MESKIFEQKIKYPNVTLSGLDKYLGVGVIDFDDLKITATIYYNIEPDDRSWGWDGIKIIITDVEAEIEWSVYSEYLSKEERSLLVKAGGIEFNGGTIEGTLSLSTAVGTLTWNIDQDIVITKEGCISISRVEIELDGEENVSVLIN